MIGDRVGTEWAFPFAVGTNWPAPFFDDVHLIQTSVGVAERGPAMMITRLQIGRIFVDEGRLRLGILRNSLAGFGVVAVGAGRERPVIRFARYRSKYEGTKG